MQNFRRNRNIGDQEITKTRSFHRPSVRVSVRALAACPPFVPTPAFAAEYLMSTLV